VTAVFPAFRMDEAEHALNRAHLDTVRKTLFLIE
jgi:hypothetical protein